MVEQSDKVRITRFCVHCLHEWEEFVDREALRKVATNEPIGNCPNPECGLPT